jgi:hypothetical protein
MFFVVVVVFKYTCVLTATCHIRSDIMEFSTAVSCHCSKKKKKSWISEHFEFLD